MSRYPLDSRRVFVYGTLRPGASRWELLQNYPSNCNLARLTDYELYYSPQVDYPWMLPVEYRDPDERHPSVTGDVLTFHSEDIATVLALLDRIEGVEYGQFRRVRVRVRTDGTYREAWAYVANPDHLPADPELRLEHGDWFQVPQPTASTTGLYSAANTYTITDSGVTYQVNIIPTHPDQGDSW